MKQRILALFLTLCLLLPLTALAADGPTLPDLGKFAGDLLTPGEPEDFGFCKRVTLYGTKENVQLVAESYVEQLLKKYDICKHAHFTNFYDGGQFRRYYALGYTGEVAMGVVGYEDANEGWQISDAAIVITYSQYRADNFLQITYRTEFNYHDTGDRVQPSIPQTLPTAPTPSTSTDTNANTDTAGVVQRAAASASTCTVCNGRGSYNTVCAICGSTGMASQSCGSCGGNGKHSCSSCSGKGYKQCGSCSGHGTRSCSSCGGTGHHSSARHGSSHHSSTSSKCSSCGGDGQRSCATCSGTGRKNCSSCLGSRELWCTACKGDGELRTTCSTCSGNGHYQINCGSCNGAGVIK